MNYLILETIKSVKHHFDYYEVQEAAQKINELVDITNNGNLNIKSSGAGIIGGIIGYATRANEDDGVFENCVNNGSITLVAQAASNIGGIVGQIRHYELLECENNGAITIGEGYKSSVELYVGGIAGYTNGRNSSANGEVFITDCTNNGEIKIDKNAVPMAGGIVGYTTQPVTVEGCLNTANVSAHLTNTNAFHIGGLVGKNGVNSNKVLEGVKVYDSTNEGNISGYTETTEAEGGWLYVGGCFGSCYGGAETDDFKAWGKAGCVADNCVNKGTVRALGGGKFRVGGISGLINRADISNCTNEGTVTNERTPLYKEEFFGGIVGYTENNSYSFITGCTNSGTVAYLMPTRSGTGEKTVANNYHACVGGILGRAKDNYTKVENCVFSGKVLGTNDKTHTWNADTGAWVAPTDFESRNFECRSAIVGACGKSFPISGCTVGGAIGSIKNFNAETGEFEIDQLHPLVNDATSLWHWAKWLTGWTSIPAATDCVFGN